MLGTLGAGYLLGWLWPELHNSGPQLLIWGFCISTVLVYQFTFAVNSLGHRVGTRRFETNDASHNNWWLALAMLGEGWHINHHKFPSGARSGFRLWELDPTWLVLRALRRIGWYETCGLCRPRSWPRAGTARRPRGKPRRCRLPGKVPVSEPKQRASRWLTGASPGMLLAGRDGPRSDQTGRRVAVRHSTTRARRGMDLAEAIVGCPFRGLVSSG